eukprot:10000258-Alexandrium_andersonii.AAC.1
MRGLLGGGSCEGDRGRMLASSYCHAHERGHLPASKGARAMVGRLPRIRDCGSPGQAAQNA